jgi:ubiquitin thioesterase protein OTUB1
MSESITPAPVNDAATQDPPPRVIDENTDMSTLTDQEIMRLMEGMDHNEDVMSKVCTTLYVYLGG